MEVLILAIGMFADDGAALFGGFGAVAAHAAAGFGLCPQLCQEFHCLSTLMKALSKNVMPVSQACAG